MLRNVYFWIVLTATVAFAQTDQLPGCDIGRNSQRPAASTNAVVFWNAVADNSIAVVGGKPPQTASVDTAIVQTAVYDAVNAICGSPFGSYAVTPDVPRSATMAEAAVAAAAHEELGTVFGGLAPSRSK